MQRVDAVYQSLLAFLDARGSHAATLVRGGEATLRDRIRVALGESMQTVASPDEIDLWDLVQRTQANAAALRLLRDIGERRATPEERGALLEYSGWGGVKPEEVPPDVLPDDVRAELLTYRKWYDRAAVVGAAQAGAPPAIRSLAGIVTQYFTPHYIASGMWGLVQQLGFQGGEALEPSAGVGRFLRTAPTDLPIRWSVVEMDGIENAILGHAFPDASHYTGTFESYVRANKGAKFNLIIGNPPYAKHAPYAGQDGIERTRGDVITYEHDYFVDRCARMLLPGGTLCLLIPAGYATDKGEERKALRKALALRCHIDAVVFLPYHIFLGARLTTIVLVATRRGRDLAEVLPEDESFVQGRILEDGLYPENSLGVWQKAAWRGLRIEGEEYVQELAWPAKDPAFGPTFDPSRIAQATLRPLPTRELDHIRDALGELAEEAEKARPPVAPRGRVGDDGLMDVGSARGAKVDESLEAAASLSARVTDYLRLVAEEPQRAELGRSELLTDLLAWRAQHGNPYESAYKKRKQADIAGFLGVFDREGEIIARALTHAVGVVAGESYVGDPENAGEIVRWVARARGYATFDDVMRVAPDPATHTRVLEDDGIAVEFVPEGTGALTGWVYYPWDEYLMGDLWPRHDRCVDMLAHPDLSAELRGRYNRQLAALLDAMQPARYVVSATDKADTVAGEVEVSLRSGFVTVETLGAFCTDRDEVTQRTKGATVAFEIVDGYLRPRGAAHGPFTANVVAYWNREDDVAAVDKGPGARTSRFNRRGLRGKTEKEKDVKGKIELDGALEDDFTSWLRNDEAHLRATLDRYNRVYRGQIPRVYSDAPISIFRLRNIYGKKLRPHQNSGLRRLEAAQGGLVAFDVGLGKTPLGTAYAALMRQKGLARRTCILVPNSVVTNWWREIREWLPDYRVCVVGQTYRADGTSAQDDVATRKAKWLGVQAGAYDVVVCAYSTFLDVAVRPDTRYDILSKEYWLLRQQSIDSREREGMEERATALRGQISDLEAALQSGAALQWGEKTVLRTREEKAEKLEEVKKQLRGIDGSTLSPADRMRLREAMAVMVGARKDLTDMEARASNAKEGKKGRGKKAVSPPSAGEIAAAERAVAQAVEDVRTLSRELDILVDLDATGMSAAPTVRNLEVWRQEADEWINSRTFRADPPLAWWEDLGFDSLVVDEAHNFKNLWYAGSRYGQPIRFLGGGGDKMTRRAWDLYVKAHHLRAQRDDTGVVLLTATPLKNSPLELFNMLSYVSSRVWQDRDISNKEAFIDRFIRVESTETLHPQKGIQNKPTALAFKNLTELFAISALYVNVLTAADLNDGAIEKVKADAGARGVTLTEDDIAKIPLPLPLPQERPHEFRIPMTEEQYAVYAVLRNEAKKAADGVKGEGGSLIVGGADEGDEGDEDDFTEGGGEEKALAGKSRAEVIASALDLGSTNPRARLLVLMDRMSKAAVDLALLSPEVWGSDIPNKALRLAEKIAENPRCGHIVFCDFNDLHPRLAEIISTKAGIPLERIASITGETGTAAQRQAVADKFTGVPARPGQAEIPATIDILIGQSKVVGEGMNLQARTCALHHYTFPWEPATIRQRNGRGVRQGNKYAVVDVYYYLSLHSFDIFRWEMIRAKLAQQASLFATGVDDAQNPMAGASLSIEELLIAFEPDPKVAAALLAELQKARAERRRLEQVNDVRKKIGSLGRAWIEIRRLRSWLKLHPDPSKEKRLAIDTDLANRTTMRLLEYDDDIVTPELRRMLKALPTKNAAWVSHRNLVVIEGEPVVGFRLTTTDRNVMELGYHPEVWLVTRIEGSQVYARQAGEIKETVLWPSSFGKVDSTRIDLIGVITEGMRKDWKGLPAQPPARVAALAAAKWDAAADARGIEEAYTVREASIWTRYGGSYGEERVVPSASKWITFSDLRDYVSAELLTTYRDIFWPNAYAWLLHSVRTEGRTFTITEDTVRMLARMPEKGVVESETRAAVRRALGTVLGFTDGKAVVALTALQYLLLPTDSPWRGKTPLLGTAGDRRKLRGAIQAVAVTDEAGVVVSRARVDSLATFVGIGHYFAWPNEREGGSRGEELAENLTAMGGMVTRGGRSA